MTLHAIIIGEKAKEPLYYVNSVRAVQGKGLEGAVIFMGKVHSTNPNSHKMSEKSAFFLMKLF